MRFIETKKSSNDNDVDVYVIALGIEEIKLLYAITERSFHYTPKVLETTAAVGRMRNFLREFKRIINYRKYDEDISKKI